jgi:hypothetical protein
MAWYSVADILSKDLPDTILIDLAFHLQANDNWQPCIQVSRSLPSDPLSEMTADGKMAERGRPTWPRTAVADRPAGPPGHASGKACARPFNSGSTPTTA